MPTNPDLAALSAAACTLADCPPGLFWFGDTLGFKSEYTTTLENPRRYQCDAYVVESGEYFHGGARSTEERATLIVRPVGNLVQIDREGMREASSSLAGVKAWLQSWATHAGNCRGDHACTCGLVRAKYDAYLADAAIAALRAENERAKEEGVRAGIEAALAAINDETPATSGDTWGEGWADCRNAIRALDVAAIARRDSALSDLIAADAHLIDAPVSGPLADSDGDDGA